MVYPIVVCGVASIVTLFLLVFVIPTFKSVFASFGGELPLPTRSYWPYPISFAIPSCIFWLSLLCWPAL